MSKLYDKYHNIIKSGDIRENEIISLRMALNGYSKTSLTEDEIYTLIDIINDVELRLFDEQTKKGINFLNNLRRTPLGNYRKNNPFNIHQEEVLSDFSHFTLDGFYDNASNVMLHCTKYHQYLPVYAVYDKKGERFSYIYANGKMIFSI